MGNRGRDALEAERGDRAAGSGGAGGARGDCGRQVGRPGHFRRRAHCGRHCARGGAVIETVEQQGLFALCPRQHLHGHVRHGSERAP